MRMTTHLLLLPALLASQAISSTSGVSQQLDIGVNPANFSVVIWNETNAFRQTSNVPKLERDFSLGKAAQGYANCPAQTNTIGHNADGRDPGARIAAAGFKACYWSENIYEQWASPSPDAWRDVAAAAMRCWKTSPIHAANMKASQAIQIGVGVAAWKHGDRNCYKVVLVSGDDGRA